MIKIDGSYKRTGTKKGASDRNRIPISKSLWTLLQNLETFTRENLIELKDVLYNENSRNRQGEP